MKEERASEQLRGELERVIAENEREIEQHLAECARKRCLLLLVPGGSFWYVNGTVEYRDKMGQPVQEEMMGENITHDSENWITFSNGLSLVGRNTLDPIDQNYLAAFRIAWERGLIPVQNEQVFSRYCKTGT